jgi:hypothetical protein
MRRFPQRRLATSGMSAQKVTSGLNRQSTQRPGEQYSVTLGLSAASRRKTGLETAAVREPTTVVR